MNYGPELVRALVPELERWQGCQLQRVEAGGRWCALYFKGKEPLFCSWEPEAFGISTAPSAKDLRARSAKTPFAMALRRHVVGGSLETVECVPGDRIMRLGFRRFVGGGVARVSWLVLELTGRMSNAVLTDDNGTIVEAARHVFPEVNRFRSVVPGIAYVAPPALSGEFPRGDMTDSELAVCLEHPLGIGRPLASELRRLWACGFSDLVRDALFGEARVFQRLGNYLTAAGTALPSATVFDGDGLTFCRRYVAETIGQRTLKGVAAKALKVLERAAGRRRKHADDLRSQIEKAESCDAYRAAGEALLQNLGKVSARSDSATLTYWDADGEKTIDVRLDPALDLQGNAKAYFKKYQKYRTDVPTVQAKLDALLAELDDITALEENLRRVSSVKELEELSSQIEEQYARHPKPAKQPKKQKKAAPPHLRFTLGNSLILVGMNERGNRYVTFEEAAPDDLWFHVHEFPGSHVILKNPPAAADEFDRAIHACASLALCYSRCADSSSVIDYTRRKQVRHISGAGPANVTYHRPQTVLAERDEWRTILNA